MKRVKDNIFGVRCRFSQYQQDTWEDEIAVLINGRRLLVREGCLAFLPDAEKRAVVDDCPVYLKNSGILGITGPSRRREYLMKLNLRGVSEEFFVPEESVILN